MWKHKKYRGLSVAVCLGRFGGFSLGNGRLCLGWISFIIFPFDLEVMLYDLVKAVEPDAVKP